MVCPESQISSCSLAVFAGVDILGFYLKGGSGKNVAQIAIASNTARRIKTPARIHEFLLTEISPRELQVKLQQFRFARIFGREKYREG